ncbi:MAG: alpha/beta hydrolase [Propionibacteriales bacterium]|nr:alpha/beta hydrolase [Propionibacteriales bacterium]
MTQDSAPGDRWPDAVVRYAAFDEALIDLHLPTEPNGTLVILVHGGFWSEQWDRTHTRPLARSLAELGYLVATPEYRRVGGSGGWPTTAYDVEAAVGALPELLTGLGLTWNRIVATGHSAGGHLVLWLASRPVAESIELVVPLAPVADLVRADELDLDGGAVRLLLDGAPVTDADPMTLLPTRPDGTPAPEVVIIHGDSDDLVPLELSERFVARHPWAELVRLAGVGHFEFLDPRHPVAKIVAGVLSQSRGGQTGPR